MPDTYDTQYTSLGSRFPLDMSNPAVVCITGRGTHTVIENRRGAMATVVTAMGRIVLGKIQIPYDGSQTFNIYDISPVGMKLIESIGVAHYHGNVSKSIKMTVFWILKIVLAVLND